MMHDSLKKISYKTLLIFCCLFLTTIANALPNSEGIQFYQNETRLSPEHKQILAEDINHYRNAEDLWGVLRSEFNLNHYENEPVVQEQINWFMSHQDFLLRSANRAAPYLYYILQQAHLRHLPSEVVLLPIFESSYNPFAYSSQGASGIWQMMPKTANGLGIKQDWWYDGRRDVIASTKAALNYLAYLKNFFDGNWILAIAAYDSGEGSVQNAIHKNIRDGISTDFLSLPLPPETRIYVPRLLALAAIISNPDKYPVYLPPVRNAPYLAQVNLVSQIDLKHAAGLAGLSLKNLLALNPGYNRATTSPHGPYKLVLPIENVEQFTENFANLPTSDQTTWQRYLIRSGDTLAKVAVRNNTSPEMLRKMNQLSSNYLKPGKTLLIPRSIPAISKTILDAEQQHYFSSDDTLAVAAHPKKKNVAIAYNSTAKTKHAVNSQIVRALESFQGHYVIQPGDTIYMTRNGDTLEHVAKHFHITTKSLQAVNPFNANKILHSGEKLVIPTHVTKSQFAKAGNKESLGLAPGDTIYMVRRGDTMEKIAEKFHTTPPAIRLNNLLADDNLRVGDHLVIPTHV